MAWKKQIKHNWKPLPGSTFVANGRVFVIEWCEKSGMYRYVRVPSFKKLEEIESE